ncbi:MAG: dinitrogenase iron-molybdenum cofactor biosynthesis protein [Verrucomicrobia bacterium]|nr:MAG: dinitrogenase iron-molybdenum cofactor biosynthesis protein [Verrucomicrobiota bacterium]
MKIAVTAQAPSLEAEVDPRFGRAAYFVFFDTETGEAEFLENPNLDQAGGVGVLSGQLMVDRGVEVVITGNCGPKAEQVLKAAGIRIVTGASGKVQEALTRFREGETGSEEGDD